MPKIIELSGIVGWEITAKGLKNRIDKKQDNVIKLDSVGGSVFEGNRLYNLLTDLVSEGVNITIELGAIAASAASYFPLAVGKENIKVRENTVFMGHKAWGLTIGNADEMQIDVDILNGLDILIAKAYSKVTGRSVDEMLEDMKNEFWLMGGQYVIDAGFASSIVEGSDTVEDDPEDVIEKAEVQARIKEAKNTLQEVVQEEDLNKWAAKLKINQVDNKDDQLDLFNNTLSVSGENNKTEDSMNLLEYLESNPEAKAEYNKLIDSAKTEGIENAVKEDRERFAEVLNLSGVKIPENILKDAKNGLTVEQFAVNELKTRNEALVKQSGTPQNMGGLTDDHQLPEDVTEKTVEEQKDKAAEDSVAAYLKKTGGKK